MQRGVDGTTPASHPQGALVIFLSSPCVGDCDDSHEVSVDEIITMVDIALGSTPITWCESGDANHDNEITVDEILTAVNIALNGCMLPTPVGTATATSTVSPATPSTTPPPSPSITPAPSTPTATATLPPTVTPSTTTPPRTPTATQTGIPSATRTASATPRLTPTETPGGNGATESVAGAAAVAADGMAVIPAVITALVTGLQSSAASLSISGALDATGAGEAAASSCLLGGQATRSCASGVGNITMTITLTACRVPTASGSVTLDGTIVLQAGGFSFCPSALLPPWTATINVDATFRDPTGTVLLLTAHADLTGTINPQLGGSCKATGADLVVSGTIATEFPSGAAVTVAFDNTSVGVAVSAFAQCVPVSYTLTFNGPATLTATTPGSGAAAAVQPSFAVTFDAFTLAQDASVSPSQIQMNGGVTAACFGGAVSLATRTPLLQMVGEPCPTSGTIRVTFSGGQADVLYLSGGAVGIDSNLDGKSEEPFPSCLDTALLCRVPGSPTATTAATAAATVTLTPPIATATPTSSQPPVSTATPTVSPLASATPTPTASAILTGTSAPSATPSRTPSPTATPIPSATPSRTPTVTATVTRSPTPTATTVAGLPNLTPFQPPGWSDKIVVTTQYGGTTDSPYLFSTDTLYVDWAVINNGTAPVTAQFTTQLYVDGTLQYSWITPPPLNANYYAYITGQVLGSLSVGTHTLTIKSDATDVVVESNEQDNQYTKTITINGIL